VLRAVVGHKDGELAAAAELLGVVCAQDLAEHDGEIAIARGVAPGRVISTVDQDARHGHRSRADRYDGYKLHLSTDVDSDLITAAIATTATTHDATVLPELLDEDPLPVQEVIADTHYGGGDTRLLLGETGIELVAPAQPISRNGEYFSKSEFAIDLEARTITCPAGISVEIRPGRARRIQVGFGQHCAACDLRSSCTPRAKGRIIEINPAESVLAEARAQRSSPEFKARYRERARAGRKNAQVKFRTQKIPWRGLVKADAWAKIRVAALNLDRMGRIPGLIG
jgi:hypothetical protein